jgi:hypothetical protein
LQKPSLEALMKENVGRADRLVRSVVGPALMTAGYGPLGGNRGKLAGLLGLITGALVVESAITRVCPLNALFGLDTRSDAERDRDRHELSPEPRENAGLETDVPQQPRSAQPPAEQRSFEDVDNRFAF